MQDRPPMRNSVTFQVAPAEQQTLPSPPVQTGSGHRRTKRTRLGWPSKTMLLLLSIGLLVLTLGSVFSLLGYQSYSALYHKDMALAQQGEQHLKNAATQLQTLSKNPLNAAPVGNAAREFAASLTALSQVDASLQSLPGIVTLVPVYGSRLNSALRLLPIAIEASQAGITLCNILQIVQIRFHDPLNTHSTGLTSADMNGITQNMRLLKNLAEQAVLQAGQLQPADMQFDPRLTKYMSLFQSYLPIIQAWLQNSDQLIAALPALLGVGTPAHYLIEVLDSTELRPGGGFIGNFGIASIAGGKLTDSHITDVYLFDWPFSATGKIIPYPPAYNWFKQHLSKNSWSFRDSNLEADFPTSAQMGELNYQREGGNVPLQGVIAITPALIQHLLTITGPLYIPEYHETVTAQNLIDRIHYHQLGAGRVGNDVPASDGHSSVRKRFTELLSELFMARVHQLPSSTLATFAQVMLNALRSRDMQVYFNASAAEQVLQRLHLAATIDAPAGDSLFVVSANISPNKANDLITNTLNDQVTIDTNGNATHHTTIRYVWATQGDVYGSLVYRDYMRIYLPPNSIVSTQSGWLPDGTSTAYGRKVIAGSFTFVYHQSFTLTLVWTVPHAATKNAQGWHYPYEIQHQAGTLWTVNLTVNPPSCAALKSSTGGFTSSSKAVALNKVVTEDLSLGVDYDRCA